MALAGRQRNFSDCLYGGGACDHSRLTPAETKEVAAAEHQRNYRACAAGYPECDESRLTPAEASAIAARQKKVSR